MSRIRRWIAPLAVAALSLAVTQPVHAAAWTARPATYDVVVQRDVKIPMSDGVSLYADVYRPAHGTKAVAGRFPVLLAQTAYNKTVPGASMAEDYFVKRGYVEVVMDVRGTGGSP